MQNVTISKSKLISILKENRAKHKQQYDSALIKWREKAVKELIALAERFNSVTPANLKYPKSLATKPEEHLLEYDRALQMLELEVNETVKLDVNSFRQYVQDEWGWKHSFAANSLSYIGAAPSEIMQDLAEEEETTR